MSKKIITEDVLTQAKIVHKGKYDYSKVGVIRSGVKIAIICPTHGLFEQLHNDHLKGRGCIKCGDIATADSKRSTTTEFIDKSVKVHGLAYMYNKVVYSHNAVKVIITCPIHGDFSQSPHHHLQGKGCAKCAGVWQLSIEEFIARSIKVHSNKYFYSKSEYTTSKNKLVITCPIHGDFEQTPKVHLDGSGCPSCATGGFNKTKPAYLYYLKITTEDNQILYKIGITNKTVNERFNLTDLSKIEIIKQKLYENGFDAWDWEQKLLKLYKQFQYKGPNILSSGNTELFTEDIVTMYYRENQLE